MFFACGILCLAKTPYPTGEKHTISIFVDQTHTLAKFCRWNVLFLLYSSINVRLFVLYCRRESHSANVLAICLNGQDNDDLDAR